MPAISVSSSSIAPLPEPPPLARLGIVPNAPHQPPNAVFDCEGYKLAFVEFDDQGICFDRSQMDALNDELTSLKGRNPIIILFAHGWKHNARSDDSNVVSFRNILAFTAAIGAETKRPALGIYAAWRGLSWYGSWRGYGILEQPTFWSRKEAAMRVALGSVRELLGRLRQFRNEEKMNNKQPLIVVIGHSFGGLLVYNAVAQSMIEAAATHKGEIVPSFVDLVLLANPAFEAARYLPLHEQVRLRTEAAEFDAGQRPIFVSVTARNDYATRYAFPLGMALPTLSETARNREQRFALLNTMGHLKWMKTHELSAEPALGPAGAQSVGPAAAFDLAREQAVAVDFAKSADRGKVRSFSGGAVLRHVGYHPHNPFWVVQATPEVIDGHNGIFGHVFADFVRELVTERL